MSDQPPNFDRYPANAYTPVTRVEGWVRVEGWSMILVCDVRNEKPRFSCCYPPPLPPLPALSLPILPFQSTAELWTRYLLLWVGRNNKFPSSIYSPPHSPPPPPPLPPSSRPRLPRSLDVWIQYLVLWMNPKTELSQFMLICYRPLSFRSSWYYWCGLSS